MKKITQRSIDMKASEKGVEEIEKFTIQGGEGGASASHPLVAALFKRLASINLTLQLNLTGG